MTIRNCDGDPRRTEPVVPEGLPLRIAVALAEPTCPMRTLQDPQVIDYLTLHDRVRRWGVLPRAGGLEDQVSADLEALDVVDQVMAVPLDWP